MKISNKFFFLIFIFSIFILTPISLFSPFVSAGEIADPMISTDVLSVDLGTFQDNTLGDGSGKLDYITGGFDLISFENLGQYGQPNPETNEVIYRAKAKWGFEVNAWTSTLFRNIYPFIEIENVQEVTFLSIQYWKHIPCIWPKLIEGQTSTPSYKIKFYDIDYGTSKTEYVYNYAVEEVDVSGSYLQHDYHGYIPVTVGIDPGLAYSGEIKVAGQTFTVPLLTSDILYTKIADMRGGECGSYEDRYTDQGIDSASVTIDVPEGTWSSTTTKLTDWFNDEDVGSITKKSNDTLTVQQSVYDLSYKGDTKHASGTSNEFMFNLPVHIQPEVTKLRNYFNLKRGGFHWYTCCGKYRKSPWTVDERITRDVSVSVQNVFVHYDFEMETDLFMTCQFEGEISESFLDDPNLIISDMIWDASIWGDETVHIKLPKTTKWWEEIIIWILIIAVVGISFYIILKYIKSKSRRPHYILTKNRG